MSWPLVKDAAATGQPLRLGGNTYETGSACTPLPGHYALDGKFERFDALVGLDETAGRLGRVKVALELDGKRIPSSGQGIDCENPAVAVRQDVRGVRMLTLIVDLGAFGDVQANVNWAKATVLPYK